MEPVTYDRSPSSCDSGDARRTERRLSFSGRSPSNLSNPLVQDALEHLALVDLIDLPNEAKIEYCRATRDLSTCGNYVQHVLNACGHASLCTECSKRFDVCPVCRSPIPDDGNRLRPRLYYMCIEAGLISKQNDERFQEKEFSGEHVVVDIQRLYSLFDVALENNLVSLICHYVTDVCMDENAVSSDPVSAFLLDEVAVKDWCKQAFQRIIHDLKDIYKLKQEAMRSNLCLLQKFASHLSGISNVLEAIASSFKETFAVQLQDLQNLFENVLKTKQHLEVMIWCLRHQFLQNVQSRFLNSSAWNLDVQERKQAAVRRSWRDFSYNMVDSGRHDDNTLFIEEALSNLGLEESYDQKNDKGVDISCLKDENSPLLFRSKIDKGNKNGCYPFRNLRIATDILFLHGTSDMGVAKQAIFLYYLFDRQWTQPDPEWKYLVDDFAASFGITRHSLLESLVYYLLDDHTTEALEEASHLLPEIAGIDTHPKIAQVLLERQRSDIALNFLRCSGRDVLCTCMDPEFDCSQFLSLAEAVTAIRVRIECGLLTEAFMSQRLYCSKAGEKLKRGFSPKVSNIENSCSGINSVEVLVTEICYLCIRRNLVDRMIELPWNSDEEKYLQKCLLNHSHQNPSSVHGSLLVVFYLQRYRYMEAYQADCVLQNLEQEVLENVDEAVALKMRSISQWRAGLIEKGLELLPEVQRIKIMNGEFDENGHSLSEDIQMPSKSDFSNEPPTSSFLKNSSCIDSSAILRTNNSCIPSKKTNAPSNEHDAYLEFHGNVPSVLQQRLLAPVGSPISRMNAVAIGGNSSSYLQNEEKSSSNGTNVAKRRGHLYSKQTFQSFDDPFAMKFPLGSKSKPIKQLNGSSLRRVQNEDHFRRRRSFKMGLFDNEAGVDNDELMLDSNINGSSNESICGQNPTRSVTADLPDRDRFNEDANIYPFSYGEKDDPVEESLRGGPRWRSGDSSEEDDDLEPCRHDSNWSFTTSQRRSKLFSR